MYQHLIFSAALLLLTTCADAEEFGTRWGIFELIDQKTLLFNGDPIMIADEGDIGISVIGQFKIESAEALLIQAYGYPVCPATFYFVKVFISNLEFTPGFGTCSDLIRVSQSGEIVTIVMPVYIGPAASDEDRAKARQEKEHVFQYVRGSVTENGRKILDDEEKMAIEKEEEKVRSETLFGQSIIKQHRSQIAALGLDPDLLKATVYGDYPEQGTACGTLEAWIASVMHSKQFKSARALEIQEGRYRGVTFKLERRPSQGFLFRLDEGDLFISHVVDGDEVEKLYTQNMKTRAFLHFCRQIMKREEKNR